MIKFDFFIILIFFSIAGYAQKEIPLSHPYSKEYVDACTKKMLETGNSYDYEIYCCHANQRNLLYDMLMADKYNNPLACYMVYFNITNMGKTYNYSIDRELWNVAFYYLQKGAEYNQSNCIFELIRIYEKGNAFVSADIIKANYYREKQKLLK